jgi:hypothetical protein
MNLRVCGRMMSGVAAGDGSVRPRAIGRFGHLSHSTRCGLVLVGVVAALERVLGVEELAIQEGQRWSKGGAMGKCLGDDNKRRNRDST